MRWSGRRKHWASGATVLTLALVTAVHSPLSSLAEENADCFVRYVAQGDDVPKGVDLDDADKRYSKVLLDQRLATIPGPWCLYDTSFEGETSQGYRDDPHDGSTQQAEAWNKRPRLVTVQLGRHDDRIVEHVTSCLQDIKDHDFIEANACALKVLADAPAWEELTQNLAALLGELKTQMDGNPDMVVAALGYYNPYPKALTVTTKIPTFCSQLVDTMATCLIRWVLLPPALLTLDQVVKRLNTTIKAVVDHFTLASQGRFVFVNPYDKFRDHCTKMNVEIKTKVYHPTNTVHEHNTSKTNFGCETTWIESDDDKGTKTPFLYLTPAVAGVLTVATQETTDMGINPNADGHKCLSDLIWNAVKLKLKVTSDGQPVDESELCS